MYITIDRYCNKCGKKFVFSMLEEEFRQLRYNIEYVCDKCETLPTINKVGSYERLDELWLKRENIQRAIS